MEKIYWFWNLVHYCIFKFEKRASFYINLPLKWVFSQFFEISFIKQGLKKRGSSKEDIFKESENVLNNSNSGLNIMISGIQMGGILVLIEYALFNFVQGIIEKSYIQTIWENDLFKFLFILSLLILPGIFNYFVLFKNNRYLRYFEKFKKSSHSDKLRYSRLTFGFVICVILILIGSFRFLMIN
jgi:hypothetical protein